MATSGRSGRQSAGGSGAGRGSLILRDGLSWASLVSSCSPGSSDHLLVVGTTGAGKGILTRAIAAEVGSRSPALVIDPEYDVILPGFYVARSIPDMVGMIRAGHIPVWMKRPTAEFWDIVWEAGNCLVVVDEAKETGAAPNDVDPGLDHLLRKGRHRNISIILAAQKRTYIDADVQALCTSAAVGLLPGAVDKQWARANYGLEIPTEKMVFNVWTPETSGAIEIVI